MSIGVTRAGGWEALRHVRMKNASTEFLTLPAYIAMNKSTSAPYGVPAYERWREKSPQLPHHKCLALPGLRPIPHEQFCSRAQASAFWEVARSSRDPSLGKLAKLLRSRCQAQAHRPLETLPWEVQGIRLGSVSSPIPPNHACTLGLGWVCVTGRTLVSASHRTFWLPV